jgi:hypothetical protein
MAELARILALPPPRSFIQKPGGNQLRPIDGLRAGGSAANSLTAGPADASGEATAQAKRFRFRVQDGAARNTQSSDLQRDQTHAATNQQQIASEAERTRSTPNGADAAASESKGIATFLAQLISQEQLGQGLHAPPLQAADVAYRRAGGEPRLDIGSPARFSLAV